MPTFTYHTFPGNGETIQAVFNMVAMLSNSGTLAGAAQAASMFGFIVMLCVAVYKLDLRESFLTIIAVAAIWVGVMTPKSSVLIEESAGYGITGAIRKVDNVPLGLAMGASLMSSFGMHMTQKMEQVGILPDDLNYSKSGMLFAARMYEASKTARIEDEVLINDWTRFMDQCSFYDMNLYHFYNVEELRYSSNILETLGKTNRALFTTVQDHKGVMNKKNILGQEVFTSGNYAATSTSMTCDKAYALLKLRTEALNAGLLNGTLAKIIGQTGISHSNNLILRNAMAQQANTSFQYLLDNNRDNIVRHIQQQAFVELIREAGMRTTAKYRHTVRAGEMLAQVQARNQYIASQKNSAWMASWNLPIVRSIFEAVLIGIFPLVAVIALLSGLFAFKTLMTYVQALLWVQLWSPIFSIINMIGTLYAKRASSHYGAVNPGSSDNLLAVMADAHAVVGGTLWLVPVISAALVMAGKGLLNGMLSNAAAAKSGAEAAGAAAGAGNFNYGNATINNANGNKNDLSHAYTDREMGVIRGRNGTIIGTLQGPDRSASNPAFAQGWVQGQIQNAKQGGAGFGLNTNSPYITQEDMNSGALGMTSQVSASEVFSRAAEHSKTKAEGWQATKMEAVSTAMVNTLAFAIEQMKSTTQLSGFSEGLGLTELKTLGALKAINDSSTEGSSIQEGINEQISVGFNFFGNGIGVGGRKAITTALSQQNGWSEQETNQKLQALVTGIQRTDAFQQAVSSGNKFANTAASEMRRAQTAQYQESLALTEAQSFKEAAQSSIAQSTMVSLSSHDLAAGRDNGRFVEYAETLRRQLPMAEERTAVLGNAAQEVFELPTSLKSDSKPEITPNDVQEKHKGNVIGVNQFGQSNNVQVAGNTRSKEFGNKGVSSSIGDGLEDKFNSQIDEFDSNRRKANINFSQVKKSSEKKFEENNDMLTKPIEPPQHGLF